jgi:CDK inhibitor PHO81
MNWKQPNHGVFFKTGCGFYTEDNGDMKCLSIQEAIRFSKRNNLLGIICEAKPLLQMPQLIHVIKESGLIVGSMGESNKNPANLEKLEKLGVDVMVLTDRVHYKN